MEVRGREGNGGGEGGGEAKVWNNIGDIPVF